MRAVSQHLSFLFLNIQPAHRPATVAESRSSLPPQRLKSPDKRVAWAEPFTEEKKKSPKEIFSQYRQEMTKNIPDRRSSITEDHKAHTATVPSSSGDSPETRR